MEVPLWHFDELSGYWLEEGMAYKVGEFYEGEVSHFSWWNCDIPVNKVLLNGQVLGENGAGISGLPVTILLKDGSWNTGTRFTGDEGIFYGNVPADEILILRIGNDCGTIIYEEEIGPYTEDTDLSIIATLENINSDHKLIELCGQLENCDGIVSNGYVVVTYGSDGLKTIIPVDTNGNYCTTIYICESSSFEIYGVDLSFGYEEGASSYYNSSQGPFDDLTVSTCSPYYFKYQIGDDPEVTITDFTISLDYAEWDNVYHVGANNEIDGIKPFFWFAVANWTGEFEGLNGMHLKSELNEAICVDIECEVNPQSFAPGFNNSPFIVQFDGLTSDSIYFSVDVYGIRD